MAKHMKRDVRSLRLNPSGVDKLTKISRVKPIKMPHIYIEKAISRTKRGRPISVVEPANIRRTLCKVNQHGTEI